MTTIAIRRHERMSTRDVVVEEYGGALSKTGRRTHDVGLARTARALVVALRPRQWTKNGLLFVALLFTLNLHNPGLLARALAAFVAFCALSSAGYLLNDVLDVDRDRQHPKKRLRPIAAGLLPVPAAIAVGIALALGACLGALALDRRLGALALTYLVLTACYSAWMKHVVLLDVFGIAAGFVVRAAAGAAAIDVPLSPWLYTATMLGALVIALGKRRAELQSLGAGAGTRRRTLAEYSIDLIDQLILVLSSAVVMTYALYTFSAANMPKDHSMMLTVPVVLYGLFRYLFLVRASDAGGAPEDLLFMDRPLLASVVVWATLSAAILYLAPA
jgi:4-hydroxybenzoate polyprenyltransferase